MTTVTTRLYNFAGKKNVFKKTPWHYAAVFKYLGRVNADSKETIVLMIIKISIGRKKCVLYIFALEFYSNP
ncbi:hypothetical protein C1S45_11570 [Lactiplantibacillus plantarum]|nr:hypothetical protein [Lactiplantibacillus plantarum]MDE4419110.1 hypothetical protein [Lactiplantibacillus plantarum]MDE4421639.1 hypothetical protein [Lactiplantibacillus plantarum]MDE4422764.1 hypothetical protein [Lactiplantibacillus plantarum]MDE4427420.1 hypothetical protein [Lactiplantibacillus plantarum]